LFAIGIGGFCNTDAALYPTICQLFIEKKWIWVYICFDFSSNKARIRIEMEEGEAYA